MVGWNRIDLYTYKRKWLLMGLFDVFGEIFFLWKFLLIVVLSGWIFTRVGSKLLATAMVSFVFWMVLTSSWVALAVTVLYLFISYVIPHGFEAMVAIQTATEITGSEKQLREREAALGGREGARERLAAYKEAYENEMRRQMQGGG